MSQAQGSDRGDPIYLSDGWVTQSDLERVMMISTPTGFAFDLTCHGKILNVTSQIFSATQVCRPGKLLYL